MQNIAKIQQIDQMISEVDQQIEAAKRSKRVGAVLMCFSLIIIWPLLLAGIAKRATANQMIADLKAEKRTLMTERLRYI